MDHLVKKLLATASEVETSDKRASAARLGREVLVEMQRTSNPELALRIAKDRLAAEVSDYSGDSGSGWQLSRKAQLVEKWGNLSECLEERMDDEAVTAVVMELAASSEFPTSEDIEKYSGTQVEGFMLDAPNELTEVVEYGGFPAEEPRPYDQWDLGDPESMEPKGPKTKTYPG